MEVAAVAFIEKLGLTLGTDGDVGRNENVTALVGAFDDLEIAEPWGFFHGILQDFQYDCAFGRFCFEFPAKILQSALCALSANLYIGSFVADVSCDAERIRRAGAKIAAEAGVTVPSRQFDNVMLQDIVREIAGYYGIRTVCRNPEAGRLRLRFLWNRDQSVERAVETLNSFEKVQLTLADSTITID